MLWNILSANISIFILGLVPWLWTSATEQVAISLILCKSATLAIHFLAKAKAEEEALARYTWFGRNPAWGAWATNLKVRTKEVEGDKNVRLMKRIFKSQKYFSLAYSGEN